VPQSVLSKAKSSLTNSGRRFSKPSCPKMSNPAFPPSVRLAVVVGQPSEPGPYTIRVKSPHGAKLMPHKHPEDRVYTVISGVFYIGLGDEFDASKLEAYPPGAVIILPGNTHHFHWAKSGEYVTQITALGPLGLEYLNAKDDPRNNKS
jgi:quercetin dioxygenase-like cupin family protein